MKRLIAYFTGKPLLTTLAALTLFIVGYLSATKIHQEGYPSIDMRKVIIVTIYPGASLDEVEASVTLPLEDALKTVTGIDSFTSISRENVSQIEAMIGEDVSDVEKAKSDIRRALDRVELPDGVTENPQFIETRVNMLPVLEIGVYSPTAPYDDLRETALNLEKVIQGVDGVARVERKGILDKEIRVLLNLDALLSNEISVQETIQAVQMYNFEVTGGSYRSGNVDKLLTVSSRIDTPEKLRKIILRSNFEGGNITLGDIARIRRAYENERTRYRYDGCQGVSLLIVKKESADIVKTVDAVRAAAELFRQNLGRDDIQIKFLWDTSENTRSRLKIVRNNALQGLVLVVIILFLFMNRRNAIWVAIGIPLSIAFAMIFLGKFGVTINSISLLGVIVVLGMIVDDAIVVSENIFRLRIKGMSWKEAGVEGTYEVALPVTTSIVTTMAAFFALYNLKGVYGQYVKEIPLVVFFVLLGSLVDALFILPSHFSHPLTKRGKTAVVKEKRFVLWMQKVYKQVLGFVIRTRAVILPLFVVLFGASLFVMFSGKVLKFISFPTDEAAIIKVNGEVRYGQNLDFTSEKLKRIEDFLSTYSTNVVRSFIIQAGELGYPEKFAIETYLTPDDEREITGFEVYTQLRDFVEKDGAFTNFFFTLETGGPQLGRSIRVDVIGNNDTVRREISDRIAAYLLAVPGVEDMTRSDEENKRQIEVKILKAEAAKLMIPPIYIGQTVHVAMNGYVASSVQENEDRVGFRVMLDDKYRNKLSTVRRLNVPNATDRLVNISNVVTIREVSLVSKIYHYNGDRTTIVEAEVDKSVTTPKELYDRMKEYLKTLQAEYPDFYFVIGGEAKRSVEMIDNILLAFWIGVAIVFCIIFLQFRNVRHTLLVMIAVPFSFIGIAISLLVHGQPLSYLALFGGVGLVGVVVNDSIVMTDYLNGFRSKMSRKTALKYILEAAATRMRPIIVTSITTVAGLLPTAYGFGGRDQMVIPCTLVMSWGLFISTNLTLLIVPSMYYIEFMGSLRGKRRKRKLRRLAQTKLGL